MRRPRLRRRRVRGRHESFQRLTFETIRWIRGALNELPFEPMPTLETDLKRLLRAHPGDATAALIQRVAAKEMLGNEPALMAAHLLGRRRAVEAIPVLERALDSDALRGHAARAIASMGAVALPTLMARLTAAPIERTAAACGLGHLARIVPWTPKEVLHALISRLDALRENTL